MDKTYFIEGGNGYGNGCGNGFGWGADGLLVGALLGGGLGLGGFGGRGGYGEAATVAAVDTASINDRIGEEAIEAKVCQIEMGLGEVKYADALNAKDIQFAITSGNNALQAQIASCCCNAQKDAMAARYEAQISNLNQTNFLAGEFCKLNQNIKDGFDGIKVDNLKERLRVADALLLQASQENQTRRIIEAVSATAA